MNPQTIDISSVKGRPLAIALLNAYGISQREISRDVGRHCQLTYRALNPREFHRCVHANLLKVRASVEKHLREAGWDGDAATLWADYDDPDAT